MAVEMVYRAGFMNTWHTHPCGHRMSNASPWWPGEARCPPDTTGPAVIIK